MAQQNDTPFDETVREVPFEQLIPHTQRLLNDYQQYGSLDKLRRAQSALAKYIALSRENSGG